MIKIELYRLFLFLIDFGEMIKENKLITLNINKTKQMIEMNLHKVIDIKFE